MPYYDPKKPSRVGDVTQFLADAREYYQFGLDADRLDRAAAVDDNRFANASDLAKEQWDPDMMSARIEARRPVLQRNLLPTYIQQVGNDGRQNKPAIKISPGDGGQPETAQFFQDRIRHIEYECNADTAYDTIRDQQVISGRGFLRVSTEWVPGKMKQRLCIEPIENQFSVVWDPAGKKYDKEDCEWWFIVSRISKAKHEREYGKKSIVSSIDFASWDNPAPDWIGVGDKGQLIQIAEYWRKDFRKRTLVELADPQDPENRVPHWKDELPEGMEQFIAKDEEGQPIEREEDDATICQYVINGAEILSETEWIGSRIPIVPLWGRQAIVDNQRKTFSLIRNAKDMQRLVNLYVSNIAEAIAQQPKTPYIAAIGAIPAEQEDAWQHASNSPKAYLLYNSIDPVTGAELPRPERIVNEPPIQALLEGLRDAIDGIKSSLGIFDASIGARSNETSGIAIERRRKESNVTTFHFPDNEARTRKAIGEILIELVPLLDKPGSNVPVRTEDKKTYVIPIGVAHKDPRTGQETTHVLTDGDYGVTVSTGPGYDSQRQEEADRDANLIKAAPELMWVFGDKLLAADDSPGSQERAERMKKAIQMKTPGLITDPNQEQSPIPPQVQQQMQGLQQELQSTQAFAQSLHQKLETGQPKLDNEIILKKMELDFKREELQVKSSTQLEVAELKAGIEADLDVLRHEISRIDQKRQIAADAQGQAADQQHEQSLQAGAQDHAAGMQQGAQAHAADMQEGSQQAASDMADQSHQQALEQQENAPQPKPVAK